MKAAKESDAMNAEQHARESIRVARTTRELLKIFSAAYHSFREHQSGDDEPGPMRLCLEMGFPKI